MADDTQPCEIRVRAAIVTIERSHGYCHPRLRIGSAPSYDPSGDGNDFSGAGSYLDRHAPALPKGCDLDCFQVTAQGESDKPGRLYGWEYEFKKHSVRPIDVAGMARTFAYVGRALDKARQDAGEPGAWADFALRICRAFKVTRLYVAIPDHVTERWQDGRLRRYDGSNLRDGLHWAEWVCWTESERKAAQAAQGNG